MCNLCVQLFRNKCRSTKRKKNHSIPVSDPGTGAGVQNEPEHNVQEIPGQILKAPEVDKYPAINVLSIFAGFRSRKVKCGITPLRFQLPDGQSHRIAQVRQSHAERVGQAMHYHFVVRSTEQRYFHIVFDAGKLTWHLVQEFDAELLFNE